MFKLAIRSLRAQELSTTPAKRILDFDLWRDESACLWLSAGPVVGSRCMECMTLKVGAHGRRGSRVCVTLLLCGLGLWNRCLEDVFTCPALGRKAARGTAGHAYLVAAV